MNKIIPLLLLICLSCNRYEVPQTSVKVNIHAVNQESGEVYAGYKGLLRTSNFSRARTSNFFGENEESIRYDSSYTDENGDLFFDVPFVAGLPQKYYELTLTKDTEIPITESRRLQKYVQYDTLIIGPLTQLEVRIKNNDRRHISFLTLGYASEEDLERDTDNQAFLNPDYISNLGITRARNTVISKVLPFNRNKFVVLQIIDRSKPTPVMLNYDVIEMKKDSVTIHLVEI